MVFLDSMRGKREPHLKEKQSLAEQFGEEVDVRGRWLHSIDARPPHQENEEEKIPVLFAHGFLSQFNEYETGIRGLLSQRRRVLSFNSPRGYQPHSVGFEYFLQDELKVSPDVFKLFNEFFKTGKISAVEAEKAWTLLEYLHEKQLEKVDVIAHSAGAVSVAVAALAQPEKFRRIVFLAPAGVVQGQGMFGLAGKLPKKRGGILEAAKNPWRAFMEGYGLSGADIRVIMTLLKEKGIEILIAGGKNDRLFPADELESHLRAMEDGPGLERDFISVEGDHRGISSEQGLIDAIGSFFDQPEKAPLH